MTRPSALHEVAFFLQNRWHFHFNRRIQGPEAALKHTKKSVFSDEHFLKQWTGLNPADQGVVLLIARGENDLHSVAGLERLSTMLGTRANKSTASHALRRLQAENIVTRLAIGEYRI